MNKTNKSTHPKHHQVLGPAIIQDILSWDIQTWSACLELWQACGLDSFAGLKVLELGANQGGLSLYFALQGAEVLCSDLTDPRDKARDLHLRYGQSQIEYRALDAMQLDLPDQSFDIVCFKSILGGIRRGRDLDPRPLVLQEILRVLKPGGWLLFGENLAGSRLHMFLRQHFIVWAAGWDYLKLDQLPDLLAGFASWQSHATGISALCGRNERQRRILARLDQVIDPWFKPEHHYCVCVAAQKPDSQP